MLFVVVVGGSGAILDKISSALFELKLLLMEAQETHLFYTTV